MTGGASAPANRRPWQINPNALHSELPHTILTGRVTPLRQPEPHRKAVTLMHR